MSDEQLMKELPEIGVVARVAPEDKIRLVDLLQRQQNIVAMTGDGVNDAPALKKADIGVAMGITGTEVSKGAAVMILTDDNFATIVKAVEFGRSIYDNLSNFIRFQMTSLVAFITAYLGAAFFVIAGGVPFTPAVVLWINFLVTVPVAIALGFDKPAPGLMERKPRPLKQPVLSRSQWVRITFIGILMAAGTLYLEAAYAAGEAAVAASIAFVTFSLASIVIGLACRSEFNSAFNRDILNDRHQLMLYGLALLLTFLPTEFSFLQRSLGLASLSFNQWMLCAVFAIALLLVDEVVKIFLRRRRDHGSGNSCRRSASPGLGVWVSAYSRLLIAAPPRIRNGFWLRQYTGAHVRVEQGRKPKRCAFRPAYAHARPTGETPVLRGQRRIFDIR